MHRIRVRTNAEISTSVATNKIVPIAWLECIDFDTVVGLRPLLKNGAIMDAGYFITPDAMDKVAEEWLEYRKGAIKPVEELPEVVPVSNKVVIVTDLYNKQTIYAQEHIQIINLITPEIKSPIVCTNPNSPGRIFELPEFLTLKKD